MIRIRSGRGVGDALYLSAIARYLVSTGKRVTVLTDHPDVFLGSGVEVQPFTREGNPRVAHYTSTMSDASITQFQAMLRLAGMPPDVPLRIAWQQRNPSLVQRIRAQAAGRPLILVHGGRHPMNRTDNYSIDLMPRHQAFECALAALGDCYRVRFGNPPHLYPLPVDADLNGSTSVADLLDLASIADGIVAQCSFAVPLAEVFSRPLLAIWASAGLQSKTTYLRTITPKKVLHNARSRFVMDDSEDEVIQEAARALLNGR